ncbi:alpha/beta fold hydrolase [Cohaesibacter intestini]|nr:alpha/beta hydrolase [Cohaesibacter intestini]
MSNLQSPATTASSPSRDTYDALPDMFPGFERASLTIDDQTFFLRTGGHGPPLLLLHGYPQNHVCWHRIAPDLADHFTLIIPDLPGYGYSSLPMATPEEKPSHEAYAKRHWADLCVGLMARLGHETFAVIGHDRGGRVAYRMALDHPKCVTRLICLDIIPTLDMWQGMNASRGMAAYHWQFLAQPYPLPERLIAADPAMYLDHTIASWALNRDLSAFDADAMAHYRATFTTPDHIHGVCEDYRAGWGIDQQIDQTDRERGKKIACPTMVISGPASKTSDADGQRAIWSQWASDLTCHTVTAGHFVAEEAPEDCLVLILDFLSRA